MAGVVQGCKCAEKLDRPINYKGDIELLHDFGFDGVKMDDCGAQRNMTRYAELMLASGRNYSIENHKKPEGHNCGDGNAIDGGEKTRAARGTRRVNARNSHRLKEHRELLSKVQTFSEELS